MNKYFCNSKKCKTCKYRAYHSEIYSCDYIFITGHSRGCDPGNKCTKYKKGNRIEVKNRNSYKNNKLNYRGTQNDF